MNLKKLLPLFIVLMTTLFIIAACSNSDDSADSNDNENENTSNDNQAEQESTSGEGELKITYGAQPPTLDTYITTSRASNDVARQMFETLVTTDSEYQVQPMLADSWEQSDDGLTYTFHLREGVLFHNGEEMVAEDVVASMNAWIEKSGPGKNSFTNAEFKEIDEYTVVMELEKPLSIALPLLAYGGGSIPGIMPKEIVEAADEEGIKEHIGTGPFKFVEWKQDQHILLERYEEYSPREEEPDGLAGRREALVEKLYFVFVADPMTSIAGLETGEYDIVQGASRDSIAQLEANEDINVLLHSSGPLAIYFNKKNGLFTDEKARQAVLYGVDMEAIAQAAYTSDHFYELNHNILSYYQLGLWGTDVGKDKYNQKDTEAAKQLLEESGYNGETIRIITTRDYSDMYNGSVTLQQQLIDLGMEVELEIYDWPTLVDRREDETAFEILFLSNTDKPDPTSPVYMTKSFAGWTDSPELDNILEKFWGAPSVDDAKEFNDELHAWFYDYVPVAKVADGKGLLPSRTTVKNLQDLDGPVLWNVSNEK
ncbi:ABC transporter substrate-binding protein [Ornithinibacillus sp. 4-3]|uniref:ABC transporter substrate-binding protein n=1 Tax=Ornithinibacillus sp. 4-3 TaxID=3231488 RepID=A0AB39HQQ9_9BACI